MEPLTAEDANLIKCFRLERVEMPGKWWENLHQEN